MKHCKGPPASLAEQLKQVLAERERRLTGDTVSSSAHMNSGVATNPVVLTQNLVEEIRQAVNEANARGNFQQKYADLPYLLMILVHFIFIIFCFITPVSNLMKVSLLKSVKY